MLMMMVVVLVCVIVTATMNERFSRGDHLGARMIHQQGRERKGKRGTDNQRWQAIIFFGVLNNGSKSNNTNNTYLDPFMYIWFDFILIYI